VESVLYGLEGVREAAVIGVPDSILGEAIKAFVVSDSLELTEAEVLRHCRAHLEDFMMPKYVEFCRELPKTSSGKIKKTDLKNANLNPIPSAEELDPCAESSES
jgi:acyl-coenzyme A synthetase/AMP-(fatty) acid ligase